MKRAGMLMLLMTTIALSSQAYPIRGLPSSHSTSTLQKASPSLFSQPNTLLSDNDSFEDDDDFEDDDFGDDLEDEFGDIEETEVYDPLSGYNRFMTQVNDRIYRWLLSPTATGYAWVVPEFVRRGIANLFDNWYFPVRFVNNALQLKIENTGEETLRFGINTTLGVFGVWDPAKVWFDLEPHREDFGQTLGHYGVGTGFHVVLPVLGPSNVRDALSIYPDSLLDPISLIPRDDNKYGVRVFKVLNSTSLRLGEYESLKKDSFDWYLFLRDAYEQNRQKQVEE